MRPRSLAALSCALLLTACAANTQSAPKPAFDGARALQHISTQVGFGPRVPNTAGHKRCRQWMLDTLKPLADRVESQSFSYPLGGDSLAMTNVIARFSGSGKGAGVLLAAHWDTRPTADEETDPARRAQPIPGANDGASGVAVLMELARQFKSSPPPVPVMLLFVDGEDYGPGLDRMFLGARHFAGHLPPDVPRTGILLDMVGDKNLTIPREPYSVSAARSVVDEVCRIARRLGYQREFPNTEGSPIQDDHLPLIDKGLKIIDLIDFDYGPNHRYWHTLQDTPDKCSAASLRTVGEVVSEWVYTRR